MSKFKAGDKVHVYQIKFHSNAKRTEKVLGKFITINYIEDENGVDCYYAEEPEFRSFYFDESELSKDLVESPLMKVLR